MKKTILFAFAVTAFFASCNNQNAKSTEENSVTTETSTTENVDQGPKGIIEFGEDTFDFGTVKEGAIIEHVFKFKNTGDAPVILAQVTASCGCTTPSYSQEPILPGKEGEVKVAFDSNNQVGVHQKIVTIASNAENKVTTVQLRGTVEE